MAHAGAGPSRTLPGCRPCGLCWDECELDLRESDDGEALILHLRLAGLEWTRTVRKRDSKLQCNLQELEVVRWVAGQVKTEAAALLTRYDVEHQPQRRYGCLFPHQEAPFYGADHDILEFVPVMTEEDLQELGSTAVRESLVLLCPAAVTLCQSWTHQDVDVSEKVYKLAARWPARQILYAPAVDGVLDIGPVSVCQTWNGPVYSRCIGIDADRAGRAPLQADIRTSMPSNSLHKYVGWTMETGARNPRLALHSSWYGDSVNGSTIQNAALQCQHRAAAAQPTRLYDAHDGVTKSGISPKAYLALSYCWSEWPEDDKLLKKKVSDLHLRLGVRYFWVDRWCINQEDEEDKTREIPCMRNYYTGASGCVVLTGPDAEPFRCVPQHDGAILSAIQHIEENEAALRSLFDCGWIKRVWTLQEVMLSRQVVYAVQDQLIDGDYISEIVAFLNTFSHNLDGADGWEGGFGCYRWDTKAATLVSSRQFKVEDTARGPGQVTIWRSEFGGQQQYEELQSMDRLRMPFEEAMALVVKRDATKQEDNIYGLLGLCEEERSNDIDIEYGIEWPGMLEKLQKAGMITERQLASSTVNRLTGKSWLPECGHGYGPFKNMERLASPIRRPAISWSEDGTSVKGALFEWEEFELDPRDWAVNNIHGMACQYVRGKLRFPERPGLTVRVSGTSSTSFSPERMSGTHVMLCRDVDKTTRDTVAVKVAGDVEGRNVHRTDGYVLELWNWDGGDPKSLQGNEWFIGSVRSPTAL